MPSTLSMPAPLRHVFVYGTLRRGELRDINLLKPAPVWVGEGCGVGVLYDLGGYPGMLPGESGVAGPVQGEVYAISPELEQLLDEVEEVWPQQTGEYAKCEIEVRLALGTAVDGCTRAHGARLLRCLFYQIDVARTVGKPQIAGGDWVKHRMARRR